MLFSAVHFQKYQQWVITSKEVNVELSPSLRWQTEQSLIILRHVTK